MAAALERIGLEQIHAHEARLVAMTREGLRGNLEVALLYVEAWLGGQGAVYDDRAAFDATLVEAARRAGLTSTVVFPVGNLAPEQLRADCPERVSAHA